MICTHSPSGDFGSGYRSAGQLCARNCAVRHIGCHHGITDRRDPLVRCQQLEAVDAIAEPYPEANIIVFKGVCRNILHGCDLGVTKQD